MAEEMPAPARSATKAEWVDYAAAKGIDPDDAEQYTKDDLIRHLTGDGDGPQDVTEPAVPDPDAPGAPAGEPATITQTAQQAAGVTVEIQAADAAPEDDLPAGPDYPARSAAKADWVKHAVTTGKATRESAEAMTRQDLIDAYGPDAPEPVPYAWIANEDLFIGDPAESGTMPARAYNAGAQVPPHDVERFGWRDKVHPPDTTEE